MPGIEAQLEAALGAMNNGLERAAAELHEEVAEVSRGVEKVSGGKAALELLKVQETETSIVYLLQLKGAASPDLSIAFQVNIKGYPIRTAPMSLIVTQPGNPQIRELKNKADVHAFLGEQATNPDSPLLVKLAFLLRRKDFK